MGYTFNSLPFLRDVLYGWLFLYFGELLFAVSHIEARWKKTDTNDNDPLYANRIKVVLCMYTNIAVEQTEAKKNHGLCVCAISHSCGNSQASHMYTDVFVFVGVCIYGG